MNQSERHNKPEKNEKEINLRELVDCFAIIIEEIQFAYSQTGLKRTESSEDRQQLALLLQLLDLSRSHIASFIARFESETPSIEITPRKMSLLDQTNIAAGEHPGIYVDMLFSGSASNSVTIGATLNIYGGFRDYSTHTDVKDSQYRVLLGQGHANRTDKISSRPRNIGLDVFVGGHRVLNFWIDFPSKLSKDSRIIVRKLSVTGSGFPIELPSGQSIRYPEDLESRLFPMLHELTNNLFTQLPKL